VRSPGDPSLQSWANGAVFYEVFVRSFQDSDGDGKGDLKGLISRLDYLNDGNPATSTDLGVDALWLMPVFASPSYHGYDTVNYEKINATTAPTRTSTSCSWRRTSGASRSLVDLVLNHTGVDHPWFVESAKSPTSAKRDWYVWSPTDLHWTQPWNTKVPPGTRGGAPSTTASSGRGCRTSTTARRRCARRSSASRRCG